MTSVSAGAQDGSPEDPVRLPAGNNLHEPLRFSLFYSTAGLDHRAFGRQRRSPTLVDFRLARSRAAQWRVNV